MEVLSQKYSKERRRFIYDALFLWLFFKKALFLNEKLTFLIYSIVLYQLKY